MRGTKLKWRMRLEGGDETASDGNGRCGGCDSTCLLVSGTQCAVSVLVVAMQKLNLLTKTRKVTTLKRGWREANPNQECN